MFACQIFLTHLFFPQVTQLANYFEPVIVASVGLASKHADHQQQMNILDQTKTLFESALQMLYAAKEGGGNPKVRHMKITTHGGSEEISCSENICKFAACSIQWHINRACGWKEQTFFTCIVMKWC